MKTYTNVHTSPSACWTLDCCYYWGSARWWGCPPARPRCGTDAGMWAHPPGRSTAGGRGGTGLPLPLTGPWDWRSRYVPGSPQLREEVRKMKWLNCILLKYFPALARLKMWPSSHLENPRLAAIHKRAFSLSTHDWCMKASPGKEWQWNIFRVLLWISEEKDNKLWFKLKDQFAGLAAAEESPVTGPACPPLSALAQCQESTASAPAGEPLGGETNQSETRWKIMTDERKKNK